jgi:hypothetical protein
LQYKRFNFYYYLKMGGNSSKNDFEWVKNEGNRSCGSYVCDTVANAPLADRANTVDQLLRMITYWEGSVDSLKKTSGYAPEVGGVWVQGFWAGLLETKSADNKLVSTRCCLLIDLSAIYICSISSSGSCCAGGIPGDVIRVPLRNISDIYKGEPRAGPWVSVTVSWKKTDNFPSPGQFCWRSTAENAAAAVGQLNDSLALVSHGGTIDHVRNRNSSYYYIIRVAGVVQYLFY